MELAVKKREHFGKRVNALRREGAIPAELYGRGLANLHLSVPAKEFAKLFKEAGTNTVVTLVVGVEKRPALIHEVARDPLTGDPAHIDFYQVRMDEKIRARVPLAFTGEAPAVKAKGAVVNKAMTEIEVEALPQDLPHSFIVDLSSLGDVNESIYVCDLDVPRGVKVLADADTAVATATPPAPVEEAKPVVEEAVADVSAVKVETEEKRAERQAEKVEKGEKKAEPAKAEK